MLVITVEGTYELERDDQVGNRRVPFTRTRSTTGQAGPANESRVPQGR